MPRELSYHLQRMNYLTEQSGIYFTPELINTVFQSAVAGNLSLYKKIPNHERDLRMALMLFVERDPQTHDHCRIVDVARAFSLSSARIEQIAWKTCRMIKLYMNEILRLDID